VEGFGNRLKKARRAAGYRTPEAASIFAQLASSSVRRWEDEENFPTAPGLAAVCVLFKCSSDHLLGLQSGKGRG